MALNDEGRRHIKERLAGFFREIGTLLVAFAPLDFALQEGTVRTIAMLAFVVAGGALFAASLVIEMRFKS